jgi:hypothetical protein
VVAGARTSAGGEQAAGAFSAVRTRAWPIRSEYKQPDAADVLPPPDAIVVAPATFNTINKWAAGISDTLALGLLTEAIGKRLPVVALPFINAA